MAGNVWNITSSLVVNNLNDEYQPNELHESAATGPASAYAEEVHLPTGGMRGPHIGDRQVFAAMTKAWASGSRARSRCLMREVGVKPRQFARFRHGRQFALRNVHQPMQVCESAT